MAPLEESKRLLKVSDFLHKLGVERLNEGHILLKMGETDDAKLLQDEVRALFDAEQVVLDRVKAIHQSLKDGFP